MIRTFVCTVMLLVIAAGISKALESREPRQGEVSAIVHMVAAELACPKVRISSVAPGPPSRRVNFTAFVSPSSDGLTYAWSVSKGKIVSQRGAMIFVEAPPGRITASVKVGGLAASCNGVATEAVDML